MAERNYTNNVLNSIIALNKKILDVERTFGVGSSQYNRYINSINAALPEGTYNISKSGKVRISKSKEAQEKIKPSDLKPVKRNPTAKQSINAGKRAMAKQKIRQTKGSGKDISEREVSEEAVSISDMEALQELAAKDYIENIENEKKQLNYDDSVKAKMQEKGAKSYTELKQIMEEGEKKRERRAKNREAARRYRERHREEINARRREQRRQARARVSQTTEVHEDIP